MKSRLLHGSICLAVAGLTFLCLGRVVANDFINLDDPIYVYLNPPVLAGLSWPGVQWAFTTTHAGFRMPLTWLSLQLDATLYWSGSPGAVAASAAAWGFHLTNLLLHVANTLLAYWLIFRLTGRPGIAAFVAALFGIHPLHVESVAWVTERKDVLSGFFGLLALLAYVRYQEKPGFGRMAAVATLFACSLMAKPVLVTLPGVMLLLDWWRAVGQAALPVHADPGKSAGQPIPRASPGQARLPVLRLVPLIGLSALCTVMTVLAQSEAQAVADLTLLPLDVRWANAVVSYQTYLARTFWPMDLGVFYPHPALLPQPGDPLSLGHMMLAVFILLAVTIAAILLRKAIPAVLVGWLWFLGCLLPNIGLVQAGNQAMADRFCYFALLGLFLALVSAGDGLVSLLGLRNPTKIALFAPLVVAYGALAWVQAGCWKDSRTLFEHTLAVTHNNKYIHGFLGYELYDRGEWDAAEQHLEQYAAGRRGRFADFQYRYGHLLLLRFAKTSPADPDLLKKAAHHLNIAVQLDPNHANAHLKLAVALSALGMNAEARQTLEQGMARTHDAAMLQQMGKLLKTLSEATP